MPAVLRHPDLRGAIDRALAQGVAQIAELSLPVPVPRDVHATVVPMDPPLADGGRAVVLLNLSTTPQTISVSWEELGYPAALKAPVRDLWSGASAEASGGYSAVVAPHAVVMVKIGA